jgi:replication factor C large subunit
MTERESWVEKYRPETWSDIQGNNKSIEKIKKWGRNWSPGDKPIMLIGDAGVGKTTAAYVLANDMDWNLNQINASSARKSEDIKKIVQEMQTTTIDGGHQLILLDEVDSWHHSSNKRPLSDALKNCRNPVIMTGNDGYEVPNGIKNKAVKFGRNRYLKFKLSKASRKAKLKDIVAAEELDLPDSHIDVLADRNGLRSAINDLQLYRDSDKAPGKDERELEMSEWEAVDNIIRGKKDLAFNINPNDFIMWLDENMSERFRGLEVAMAYRSLALSDKWLGVAQSTQDYSYWKYAGELQEQVANLRLTEPYDGYIKKEFPGWFRQKMERVNDGSSTAGLFNKLKDNKNGRFEFAGNYLYFRKVMLPILQDQMDEEEKFAMAMEYRLDAGEMEVLGVSESQVNNWKESTSESEANITQSDALDW